MDFRKNGWDKKMFETKEIVPEKRKKRFYNIMMGYWLVVSAIYFVSFMMMQSRSGVSFEQLLSENITLTLNILTLSINLIFAYLLYATDFKERKKGGIADRILKAAILQQLLTANIIGAVLAFLALNELTENPLITEAEEKESKPLKEENKKGIMILLGVILVLSLGIAYANWKLN